MIHSIEVRDFNLEATLESGQVFGFARSNGAYSGLIKGRRFQLWQKKNKFYAESSKGNSDKIQDFLKDYFDLERDLTVIRQILEREEPLKEFWKPVWGLRLIRQNSWEALACFIISSNNNVKRIQGIWRNLSQLSAQSGAFPLHSGGAVPSVGP